MFYYICVTRVLLYTVCILATCVLSHTCLHVFYLPLYTCYTCFTIYVLHVFYCILVTRVLLYMCYTCSIVYSLYTCHMCFTIDVLHVFYYILVTRFYYICVTRVLPVLLYTCYTCFTIYLLHVFYCILTTRVLLYLSHVFLLYPAADITQNKQRPSLSKALYTMRRASFIHKQTFIRLSKMALKMPIFIRIVQKKCQNDVSNVAQVNRVAIYVIVIHVH